ncbi:MAG TPA: isochorismatase family protein [Polyangiaceae bacterium]|nr:isochorismatase family protein [Polyangiaceae bacterium]
MQVLIDVDVQNDFCDPSGALFVAGSPCELFASIVRRALDRRVPILGSVDSHAFDAWEFASSGAAGPNGERPNFPDHCVKGTWGWLKVPGTLPSRFRFSPRVAGQDVDALAGELVRRESQALYFEKEVYSLFANPNAAGTLDALARSASEPLEAWVFGVATDYCVKAAVLGLRERGLETVLIEDAVRGITPAGTETALAEMRAAGARVARAADFGVEG